MTGLRSSIAILLAVAVLAGCEEPVTYGYFRVTATIDPASVDEDLLKKINGCGIVVEGARNDRANIACTRGSVRYNLGKFEYSVTEPQGSLNFKVLLADINGNEIARGESGPVSIVPKVTTAVTVVVRAVPGFDAGADDR